MKNIGKAIVYMHFMLIVFLGIVSCSIHASNGLVKSLRALENSLQLLHKKLLKDQQTQHRLKYKVCSPAPLIPPQLPSREDLSEDTPPPLPPRDPVKPIRKLRSLPIPGSRRFAPAPPPPPQLKSEVEEIEQTAEIQEEIEKKQQAEEIARGLQLRREILSESGMWDESELEEEAARFAKDIKRQKKKERKQRELEERLAVKLSPEEKERLQRESEIAQQRAKEWQESQPEINPDLTASWM